MEKILYLMEKKLYLIANTGCDDVTYGLARFNDKELAWFKNLVTNLNMNSTYGCQPTISLSYIPEDFLEDISNKVDNDKYGVFGKLYLDGHVYIVNGDKYFKRLNEVEVIF